MAFNQFDLSELLDAVRSGGDIDLIRTSVEAVLQALIDAEATAFIGAEPHERTDTRTNQRNGSRPRLLATKAGDVNLAIPKLRQGSFFPSILDRRRRIDAALYAVVMEAYVHGVSTRKVDDLVAALGAASGISKSEVSRICAELDETLSAFRDRPLDHVEFPYVFLDATYIKARSGGRIVSKAVIVATGVSRNGDREVLGVEVGDSEDGAFWIAFLRSLKARKLHGVQLVISDAHTGLHEAIGAVMHGATWQRCKVHLARNVLAKVPKASQDMVAAAMRTIYAQPDAERVHHQFTEMVTMLEASSPTPPGSSTPPATTSSRSRPSPKPTGARSGRRTPSSASTPRSSAAPASSGSSPTTPPSSALSPPSSPRPTTSGKSPNAATSPRQPWPASTTSPQPSSPPRSCLPRSPPRTPTTTRRAHARGRDLHHPTGHDRHEVPGA